VGYSAVWFRGATVQSAEDASGISRADSSLARQSRRRSTRSAERSLAASDVGGRSPDRRIVRLASRRTRRRTSVWSADKCIGLLWSTPGGELAAGGGSRSKSSLAAPSMPTFCTSPQRWRPWGLPLFLVIVPYLWEFPAATGDSRSFVEPPTRPCQHGELGAPRPIAAPPLGGPPPAYQRAVAHRGSDLPINALRPRIVRLPTPTPHRLVRHRGMRGTHPRRHDHCRPRCRGRPPRPPPLPQTPPRPFLGGPRMCWEMLSWKSPSTKHHALSGEDRVSYCEHRVTPRWVCPPLCAPSPARGRQGKG
jgi:hypothetical protein